jgi:protein TonB
MRNVLLPVLLALVFAGAVHAQTQQDTAYMSFAEKAPFPAMGMAELTNRVVYPEMAVTARIEGTVYVSAFVNEHGAVDSVVVAKPVHHLLDSAAVRAVRSTKFTPGLFHGKPVKAMVTVPVKFRLKE